MPGTIIVLDMRDHLKNYLKDALDDSLNTENPDHKIIATALAYQKEKSAKYPGPVVFVTADGVATVTGLSVGLRVEGYATEKNYTRQELSKFYTGRMAAEISVEQYKALANRHELPRAELARMLNNQRLRLYPNQFVLFVTPADNKVYETYLYKKGPALPADQLLGCYNPRTDTIEFVPEYRMDQFGFVPNTEQRMELFAALSPRIRAVLVTGTAGTGKTAMALAAGRTQLESSPVQPELSREQYQALVLTKADDMVGKREIGFLPGDENEKMGPVYESYNDALAFVIAASREATFLRAHQKGERVKGFSKQQHVGIDRFVTDFINGQYVEMKHFGFFRGRTFHDRYVIFDEAQNLDSGEMKTLVTRIGEDSKLIAMGDVNQIDVSGGTDTNNGLSHLIRMHLEHWDRTIDRGGPWPDGSDQVAVVSLVRSMRSTLVEHMTNLYENEDY